MPSIRWNLGFITLLVLMSCVRTSDPLADLMNAAQPLPGITTSGQPSQAALQKIADAGYVTVIDLRGINEDRGYDEKGAVEALGMEYISLPISGAEAITYENASLLNEKLSEIDGPVLLHCSSSNRVGALLSLRERMQGASTEDALNLGIEAGLASLRPTVEERLGER
jgi:uncharacterized protein (TIGR01244 family)